MISFTIDAGVFALKQKTENLDEEYKNIQQFVSNMFYLQFLDKCPSVTVSYMNLNGLVHDSLMPAEIRPRIAKIINSSFKLNNYSNELIDFFDKIHNKINKKGKIGIYENIFDKEKKIPDRKYNDITYNYGNYPFHKEKNLSKIFKRYLGLLSEMNCEFYSDNNNYMVLSGNAPNIKENITMCYRNFKQSMVNIIGVQKTGAICKKINSKTSTDNVNDNLVIGRKVNYKEIEEKKCLKNNIYIKLYNYMKSMNEIINIINNNKINCDNEKLVLMINAHGCLCSQDNENYSIRNCPHRIFEDENGQSGFFDLHLKPITETKEKSYSYTLGGIDYNSTFRIFFKLVNQKFLVGWIGTHQITCFNCDEKTKAKCNKKPLSP